MGFRYRKSFNLGGGVRINISKSGVGYSWGVKGYRITKTAKGNTRRTATIPGTGISFVDETGKNKSDRTHLDKSKQYNQPIDSNHYDTEEIVNTSADNMASEGLEDILAAARKTMKINKMATIGIIISLLISVNYIYFILPLLGCIILKIYVKTAGLIDLDYIIDDDQQETVNNRIEPMLKVTESNKVWRVIQSSKVIDKKYSGGASNTVNKIVCKSSKETPFPFRSNIQAATFKIRGEILIFLPDKLFVIQKNKVGALNYADIQITKHMTRFMESDKLPSDAQVVGKTWKYVNKSGGPDKRFKNNPELPICLYGEICLKSESGLNTVILFSNASIVQDKGR